MATVTRYIYSHYDPRDRTALELATGQLPSGTPTGSKGRPSPEPAEDEGDPWVTESTFSAQRRLAAAPRFVPAAISYDELNNMLGGFRREVLQPPAEQPAADVSEWYRSVTRQKGQDKSIEALAISSERPSTAPASQHTSSPQPSLPAPQTAAMAHPRPDKNNWFITRVFRSESSSAPRTPLPTLADILARELPMEAPKPFKPPVFLALGPSNKGWGMLQRKGWNEGEGLGANVAHRAVQSEFLRPSSASKKGKASDRVIVKTECQEVQLDDDGDISELRKVEVVDLTLSDSEDEMDEEAVDDDASAPSSSGPSTSTPSRASSPHSIPLLTPIPTILKSDRLGIGLKAKRVGPYKASKKRVTHNQAALAAHIRSNEEMRRMKAKVGRGTRGFAKLAKADSEQRRQLLASLNER